MALCGVNTREMNTMPDWAGLLDNTEMWSGLMKDWQDMQCVIHEFLAILPVHLLVTDENGRVIMATPKMLREVFGAGREAVCDRYLTAVLKDCVDGCEMVLRLGKAVEKGVHWRGEMKLRDGQNVGVRACPLPLGDRHLMIVMMEMLDVKTEPVWWRRLMGMVDENREMITRGRLSGGVMHDVKNMVQNLSGNVQCMELKVAPGDKLRTRLDMMNSQIAEMTGLINNYLQMGRESTHTDEYAVNDLLHETVELIGGNVRMQRMEIIEEPGVGLPALCLDAVRIKQVFMNCLENCMDAIAERRRRDGDERLWGEILVRSAADAAGVEVCIEDNGVGLTDEQLARFFEPFFTTKENGHGIGASFSRAVVELHGGTMSAENVPGGGCRVRVWLPEKTRLADGNVNFYDEMAHLQW